MKQVLQYNRAKAPELVEIPQPQMKGKGILVDNRCSLISVGTERQMIELSQMSIIGKARQRPDLVKQVLQKVKTEGLTATYNKVMGKLRTPLPLGYSSAGIITEVDSAIDRFTPGERAACAGFAYACHAESIYVPANLAVKIPENVSFEQASFVTLGAIALQGVRVADLHLGENVAVIGLGLLGQLTCMLLSASGCKVIGIDIDKTKLALAENSGASLAYPSDSSTAQAVLESTAGRGVDAVIITAATDSAAPIELAGEICREKGKVVVVGAVKMDVPRKIYYEKELELRLSRSYGPGRYDYTYEESGQDYPYGYVRWTENRNMQSFLELISNGKINLDKLITHRFDISQAEDAYELISNKSTELILGVLLNYPEKKNRAKFEINLTMPVPVPLKNRLQVGIGFVGAGGFASGVLLPHIKNIAALRKVSIMSGSGVSAATSAESFGFERTASSYDQMLIDSNISALFIANRHNQHAEFVLRALKAKKPVFVEKPLCLNIGELSKIISEYNKAPVPVLVGFNRRFAPLIQKMKSALEDKKYPLSMHYRINAGFIPSNNWIQDEASGGGRIVGEICHFVDLLSYLAGATPIKVTAESLAMPDENYRSDDNVQIMIRFSDGSVGTINYVASGNKLMSKEYLEVFGGGVAMRMDDFTSLTIAGKNGIRMDKSKSQDKGHRAILQSWADCLMSGSTSPIPFSEIVKTTQTTFDIISSLEKGAPIWIEK